METCSRLSQKHIHVKLPSITKFSSFTKIGCPCNTRRVKLPPPPQPTTVSRPKPPAMASSMSLEEAFKAFSKFGDTRSDGTQITLSQADKWMKQASVIDGKKITTTDTGICFNKFKSKSLQYTDFVKYVEDLANYKKVDAQTLKDKLINCGAPGTPHTTGAAKLDVTDRLTDTSKYTGAHKQRFDDSGKGKGIEGREDVKDGSGYVQGYKDKDTFDKKMKN